ncbi:MerC domain-containing protein [Micromonospora sp. NPDC003776]
MADRAASAELEFRYSPRRHRRAKILALLGAGATLAAYSVLSGEPWWEGLLRYGLIGLAIAAGTRWHLRDQPRLPLRLTAEALELTGPDGTRLAIDWTDLASARVRGGLDPRLVVEPVDPRHTRPPLRPYQWATPGQRRPYELTVRLSWMTPGRDVLCRELARRLSPAGSAGI